MLGCSLAPQAILNKQTTRHAPGSTQLRDSTREHPLVQVIHHSKGTLRSTCLLILGGKESEEFSFDAAFDGFSFEQDDAA